ncbi:MULTISPECIES: helix-turn-helix transcriptional regulator [Acinetobacter]|jgi:putative transcriptional regulator|uniref:helix-turn-helix transcriptional regulator n=1 Tax=Acinetobacter TaxID=469 RepID=UPI001EF00F56|nr:MULTISPECIES: helix-turn-helix transcriptional regulator [Acinetobacter]MCG7221662.1 helix-turn-helix transcriptional regulator [Acinetobacter sp. AG3]MDO6643081.1 helix-turn-helix transcriptional regulator [Acinetobacter guillouiae]
MKNILSELRAQQGWSQQQLAEYLGVSRQTINAIEKQRYDPSLPLAFKIAKLFNRSIEAIFKDEESFDNENDVIKAENSAAKK